MRDVAVTGAGIWTATAVGLEEFGSVLRDGAAAFSLISGPDLGLPSGVEMYCSAIARSEVAQVVRSASNAHPDLASLPRLAAGASLPLVSALVVAAQAACGAGLIGDRRRDDARTTVIIAGSNFSLRESAALATAAQTSPASVLPSHLLRHMDVDLVGAVSGLLGLRGMGFVAGAGPASGTSACALAHAMLDGGVTDRCLVVAPASPLGPAEVAAALASGAMATPVEDASPQDSCRPFDRGRRGFVYGDGAAAIVLESGRPCTDAARLGQVLGSSQVLDGVRGTQPSAEGQLESMRRSIAAAGIEFSSIGYINAHAAGSVVGDPIEMAAIAGLIGRNRQAPIVNSTKSIVGHCLGSSGLVGVVATLVQLREGFVHGNLNLSQPLACDLRLAPPESTPHEFSCALVNGVGFSGINSSLVLAAH